MSVGDEEEEDIVLGGLRGRRVQAQVMEAVPGYTYFGYGWCSGANVEDGYHNVQQVYTQTLTECGAFCNKFPVNELRGFTWVDGGGGEKHCYCMFDSGTDVQSLAKEYGGSRENWGTMTPAKHSDQGTASGPIQNVFDRKSGYDAYCYSLDTTGLFSTSSPQATASSYRNHFYPISQQRSCIKNLKLDAPTYMYDSPQTYFFPTVDTCCSSSYVSMTDVNYCLKVSNALTDITSSSGPQIGDQRVSFTEVPASTITIVGVQNGNTLSAFVSDSGEGGDILLFKQGSYSSVEMYDEAEASNAAATWMLRFVSRELSLLLLVHFDDINFTHQLPSQVGFIAMALGLYLIFRPIEVFADIVPCVGSIIGCGIIFMSVLLAGILSTVTISIAWLAAQPKIGAIVLACLLIVVGSCAFGFKKIKGKQNADDHDDDDIKLEANKDEELEVVDSAVPTVEAIPEQEITVASFPERPPLPEQANEPPKPYVP